MGGKRNYINVEMVVLLFVGFSLFYFTKSEKLLPKHRTH